MKVTKKDILSIKAGSSKVMQLDSYKDCVNARSYAYWKIQCKLPPKTKRFCPLVLK